MEQKRKKKEINLAKNSWNLSLKKYSQEIEFSGRYSLFMMMRLIKLFLISISNAHNFCHLSDGKITFKFISIISFFLFDY